MFDFKIPSDGLTLIHDHNTSKQLLGKDVPQIIQLSLVESVTKDILKALSNNESVRLKSGKKPTVHYGRKQISLNQVDDEFPSEIFHGPLNGTEPVYFSGKLSHTLEAQKAKQDTAQTDEALAALENTLKTIKENQASNEASFMGSKNDQKKKDVKSLALSNRDRLRGTTTPSTPFMGTSPRLGPTSNPFLSSAASAPSKDKIRQDAMRIPMVHLLAMNPSTPKVIAGRLNVPISDCEKVLERIAKDGSGGNKELKEKCFRELDVYKFPYPKDEDRQAAITRAIHAYDRMRIDKNDVLWQMLLPLEERGKGKFLSRLNFEKPPPAPTPKLGIETENKADSSDREGKAKKAKTTEPSKESMHKKKASGDIMAKKKLDKTPIKTTAQSSKLESKYKSSERIEDSDEEAEGVEVAPAKAKPAKLRDVESKTTTSPKPRMNGISNSQHKSKLSNSSLSSNDLERPHSHDDRSKLKPRSNVERSPSNSRISPRPRVNSSPQKPSPLGSSPPTNSTDLEISSKSSIRSSASSSPPSSTDMPLSQARKTYSPVIAEKSRNATTLVKRKGTKGEEPPSKRQQTIGLGLQTTLTNKSQQSNTMRRISDSSLSSPEKSNVTKDTVVAATLKFHEYYAVYKDLHLKLSRMAPDDRPDRELEQLRIWHERLVKIKSELWTDWEKAGGEMPI